MVPQNHLDQFYKRGNELGAESIRLIPSHSIIVENRTILKCIFGCNGFGNRVCPPYIPSVDEFRKMLSEYENALLVNWRSDIVITKDISENFQKYNLRPPKDKKSRDLYDDNVRNIVRERYEIIQPGVLELEKLAWTLGYNMAMGTFPGMCSWCANEDYTSVDCTGADESCRYPTLRRPCLMGLGIRLDKTLDNIGVDFQKFPLDGKTPSQYTFIFLE